MYSIATAYFTLDNRTQSNALANEALSLIQAIPDQTEKAYLLASAAHFYGEIDQSAPAIAALSDALKVIQAIADSDAKDQSLSIVISMMSGTIALIETPTEETTAL
ncbi:MAG: hypothetical protein HC800_25265 [Phormidesmis sp. RL_2_1]|nr:hypothetical protein [Phormidesmis sp. RL_2_1]